MKKLVFLVLLTACGTADEQSEQATVSPSVTKEIPSLAGWQTMTGASDSCTEVTDESMTCTSTFTGKSKNCSDATFKFIAKKNGLMHVLTVEHVFIRQGQPHAVEFKGKPEVYETEETQETNFHAFQCYGPNGEIVRL